MSTNSMTRRELVGDVTQYRTVRIKELVYISIGRNWGTQRADLQRSSYRSSLSTRIHPRTSRSDGDGESVFTGSCEWSTMTPLGGR